MGCGVTVYVDDYRAPYRSVRGYLLRMSHMMAGTPRYLVPIRRAWRAAGWDRP